MHTLANQLPVGSTQSRMTATESSHLCFPANYIERNIASCTGWSRNPSWLVAIDVSSMNFSTPLLKSSTLVTITVSCALKFHNLVMCCLKKHLLFSVLSCLPFSFSGWLRILVLWEMKKSFCLFILSISRIQSSCKLLPYHLESDNSFSPECEYSISSLNSHIGLRCGYTATEQSI